MAMRIIFLPNVAPNKRTVRSVARNISGNVSAPQVVCKPKTCKGICTR